VLGLRTASVAMLLLLCAYADPQGVARQPAVPTAPTATTPNAPPNRDNRPLSFAPQTHDTPGVGETPGQAAGPRSTLATAPTLDLPGLEERLRNTSAIGLFTKLSLKNPVDDLLAQFKSLYSGGSTVSLAELRQKFELLLMKVVLLLQDDDPGLAAAVSSSREALWGVLSDPKKFANLE
jgi:hypothetical protein